MPTARDGGARPQRWQRLGAMARSPWLRAGVTLLLLALVFSRLDWGLIEQRLRQGRPLDFLLAVALVLLALVAGACRWRALLHRAGIPLGTSRLARIYAVSMFSTTFLPTAAGGDVTRALLVTRRGPELRRVVVSVLMDRAGGLAGLITIAWLALALEPSRVPDGARAVLGWTTLGLALGVLLMLAAALRGGRVGRRLLPARVVEIAREAREVLRDYARSPGLLAAWLLLSVAYQALIASQLVVLGHAIDVELPFATAAVALALVTIVTMIPRSIGGFGIREGSYVVLLGGASIAASDATLISVLSVAALLVASLPGAYLIARGDIGAAPEPAVR
ncbi:MAG: lysylphosphatidylglycerol synthase transmembrane domain-containing protein [Conexibacter sp.]